MNDDFDRRLREAAARFAEEPLHASTLDPGLDGHGPPRWRGIAGVAVAAVLLIAVMALVGPLARPFPDGASPSPAASGPVVTTPPSSSSGLVPDATGAPSSLECAAERAGRPAADEVLVYFMCEPAPADPRAVLRVVPLAEEPLDRLRSALAELMVGPTSNERATGLAGPLPPGLDGVLQSVELQDDGLAIIDFSETLVTTEELAMNASHNRFVLFKTVEETAFQFKEVTAVEYRLDGDCDAFARSFEMLCDHAVKYEPFVSVMDCPVMPPAELPSGRPVTTARMDARALFSQLVWGSGTDTVHQYIATLTDGDPPESDPEGLTIHGHPAVVHFTDSAEDLIQIAWFAGDCWYLNFVSGMSIAEAVDFAERWDGE